MIKNVLKASVSLIFMCIRSVLHLGRLKYSPITIVSPFAKISIQNKGNITIGKYCGCRDNTELKADGGTIQIGERCFINRNCMIVAHNSISIGRNTTIGPGTVIYDHDHDGKGGFVTKPIQIGARTWIGANCVILKGVHIGNDCTIAAGSVISKNVPDNSLVIQKRNTYVFEQKH